MRSCYSLLLYPIRDLLAIQGTVGTRLDTDVCT